MGKYQPLGHFLRNQPTQEVPLTFREIEKITGVKLPPKAQHQRAWWSNNPDNNVMTKVWLAAGFESAQVDMEGRKLVFRRVATASDATPGFAEPVQKPYATKDGRHPARREQKRLRGSRAAAKWRGPWPGKHSDPGGPTSARARIRRRPCGRRSGTARH